MILQSICRSILKNRDLRLCGLFDLITYASYRSSQVIQTVYQHNGRRKDTQQIRHRSQGLNACLAIADRPSSISVLLWTPILALKPVMHQWTKKHHQGKDSGLRIGLYLYRRRMPAQAVFHHGHDWPLTHRRLGGRDRKPGHRDSLKVV